MKDKDRTYRNALAQIAKVASAALNDDEPADSDHGHVDEVTSVRAPTGADYGCSIKSLPERLLVAAAETAVRVSPMNAPARARDMVLDPQRIAVLTTKYWGLHGLLSPPLTVSFMEATPADLRDRILSHMNAWNVNIRFVWTQGTGQVRISRGTGGYWSYLGTDILHIPTNRPTMNLQGFTMSTPESEYKRVVRHEIGHTLGFPHEHMRRQLVARIDPEKAYDYFGRTQGWSRQDVDQQVLTPLNDLSIFGTAPDQTSIMCYQLPGTIMRDGKPIPGGTDINSTDGDFAHKIYPTVFKREMADNQTEATERAFEDEHAHADMATDDWDESEDVTVEI